MKTSNMKMKQVKKSLLGLAMAGALVGSSLVTPVQAYAGDPFVIPENPKGTTMDSLEEGYLLTTNYGTVTTNNGEVYVNYTKATVTTNNATVDSNDGTVKENNGMVVLNWTNGSVDKNNVGGVVESNDGFVDENYGMVQINEGETGVVYYNYGGGTVTDNKASVFKNWGNVVNNYNNVSQNCSGGIVENNTGKVSGNDGTVLTNAVGGTVAGNYALVTTNNGTVSNYTNGTVTTNNGTITNNRGTVTTNNGTVSNYAGGTVATNAVGGTITGNAGTVENNKGKIISNDNQGVIIDNADIGEVGLNMGTIKNNVGKINDNGGVVENNKGVIGYSSGKITTNMGTLELNSRTVATNAAGGTVTLNDIDGTVTENNGTITNNRGTVTINNGTVENNYEGTVNGGTVLNQWYEYYITGGTLTRISRSEEKWWKIWLGKAAERDSILGEYYITVKPNAGMTYDYIEYGEGGSASIIVNEDGSVSFGNINSLIRIFFKALPPRYDDDPHGSSDSPSNQDVVIEFSDADLIAAAQSIIATEEAVPVTAFVSAEAVEKIPAEARSAGASFNLSMITTPQGVLSAVNKISDSIKALNAADIPGEKVTSATVYSDNSIIVTEDVLKAISASDIDFVFFFRHNGKMYKVTIPRGTKIDFTGHKCEGLLYIGRILGTTEEIKLIGEHE